MADLAEQPHDPEPLPAPELIDPISKAEAAWDRREQEARDALKAHVPPSVVWELNLAASGVVDQLQQAHVQQIIGPSSTQSP